ncbi:fanconi-associated nuclease 1-like protein isoform X1 [Iris pallida]|uniref:Fanconi-associated nuclease n=1 Tax=Iris pallida TaxID=29817 RepID=A0AAX6F0D2_IRIPA|nr:fanconi-associated nuclease 1-like protein isoform X1 [Iris pallida]
MRSSSSLSGRESLAAGAGFVSCPVCGASIRATDINPHLDTCLARGTKRKLTQRTLLQLSFSTVSGSKSCSVGLDDTKKDVRKIELTSENEPNGSHIIDRTSSSDNNEQYHYTFNSQDCYLTNSKQCIDAPMENKGIEEIVSCKIVDPDSSCMFPQSMSMTKLNAFGAEDANYMGTLETFIVGRKFHDNVELQQGASISIIRDPQNTKDRHAIKVLSADSDKMLGYLPRELAKCLSPLIDNHFIKCEGSVISPAKHPLDVVPVQLVCQKVVPSGEVVCDDHQAFVSLWENVQHVTEYAKTFPPSMTKYQHNFHLMIDDVMKNYAHLFTSSERSLLGSFDSLGTDGQRLFIRLYMRKGPWFRMSDISYPEISDLQKAIGELQSADGYIFSFSSSDDVLKHNLKEVLEVLNVLEMREIANMEIPKKGIKCARRQELIDSLFAAFEDGTCPHLPKVVLKRAGTCIKISSTADALLWRVQRLFFLNGEQDLSSFLLVDLGLIKFPDYNCIVRHPVFRCRNDLLEYEEAVEVAQMTDEFLDENNIEMVMRCINISESRMLSNYQQEVKSSAFDSPPTFFYRFSAASVYSKVLFLGVSFFERERRYDDAIRLLRGLLTRIPCDSMRGNWTLRLSVDLEHIGRVNESLSVAEEGVLDPWVRAGSKMALQRRVLRLGKPPRRWKTPSYANSVTRKIKEVSVRGRPLTSETGSKNLFYGFDGELCGVEQLALQYYAEEGGGWHGVHSESGIWMTIFGILMWDVIFADIPDVFRSRFQVAPLDLCTDDFYAARKTLIESHLQKIQEGMAEEMLITSWDLHAGTACQGVDWERRTLSDLRAAVSCIGGSCLASLCRHLALDYKSWSSGMPDLLLWRFRGGDADGGEAKLVEVKGPKDRLSEQQRAWILILMDCGFDIEVCNVSPTPKSE